MDSVHLRSLLDRASAELQRGQHQAAEANYRKVLEREPRNAEATHFLGVCLCRTGRGNEGLVLLRRSVELDKAQPMFRLNLGLLLAQHDRLAEAEACFSEALSLQPRSASLHNYLGTVLQRRGDLRRALAAYEKALALDPGDDSVHNHLGYARFALGEIEAAIGHYGRALELNPRNAMAHNNLGNALQATGRLEAALASYRRAVEIEPGLVLAHQNLGVALRACGELNGAISCFRTAARLAPAESASWQLLADALADVRFTVPDEEFEADLATCLARDDVEQTGLGAAVLSLLRTDAAFESVLRSAAEVKEKESGNWLAERAQPVLRRALFLRLIENSVVPDPGFERFIATLRRALLSAWHAGRLAASEPTLELVCALAHQCHLDEYAMEESAAETVQVARLQSEIEEAGAGLVARLKLALFASYRPLMPLAAAASFPKASAADSFGRLIQRQILEPREERRLREEIVPLTAIEDPVSRAVQAQYEENPYPRWHHAPSLSGSHPLRLKLLSLFPQLRGETLRVPDAPRILIAGCGTGRHVAITARLHPTSRILAVDISKASLAYAMRRSRELGIGNVRFAQADLLRLWESEERFDLIECAGVLHHLRDPLAGWRVLVGLLRPGGFMKIALYSEMARRGVEAAQRLIGERGFEATAQSMRSARAAIMALPDGAPEKSALNSIDFYCLSGCRDLLFHVEEHRFTPGRIAAALRELGLEFIGFEPDDPLLLRAYRAQYPDDPSATSLANWTRFEAQHPDTFAAMYQFWVRAK